MIEFFQVFFFFFRYIFKVNYLKVLEERGKITSISGFQVEIGKDFQASQVTEKRKSTRIIEALVQNFGECVSFPFFRPFFPKTFKMIHSMLPLPSECVHFICTRRTLNT